MAVKFRYYRTWPATILGILTALIGHTIHGSLFWCALDFIFFPVALVKWLICQEINLSVIRQTFSFFLK